jgi:F-type H+-transporting ATPase subunit epsilon
MSQFHIDVVTPKGIRFSGEAVSCTAPGINGEFQVLKDHAPLVAQLTVGEIKIDEKGNIRWMATSGGFLEVKDNIISIIAETAEWAEDIELERAHDAEKRARDRLHAHDEDIDVSRAEMALARALNRIKVASYI